MCCVGGWVGGCVVWGNGGWVCCVGGWVGGWVCCVGGWEGGMLKDDITEVIIMPHWIVGVARYSHYKNDSWYPVCNL